ncbi:hypothetical protein MLD38_018524 [Melastoma candidum]|uniref:Uncharacterized protein n=1 Tax=Melastoma candidum TaxID=119954 RepID=A0ACB9QX77_9MYRT|nr:hypothetical protein MLD38_018524 [Melastoma candidum]
MDDDLDFVPSTAASDDAIPEADYIVDDASQFDGERCGICMDVIIDRGVLDCCQDWFCFTCIDNWSTITNLCPLCQNEFQMITCVPVYDTIGSNKFEEESSLRDDDWCMEGNNNSLSFPSYYIDEDAVFCLDGSDCKIRGGAALSEGFGSEDTSIACDSCDIWYHAFCVGFDPEGDSETWLCPRCMANEMTQSLSSSLIQASSCHQENDSNECVFQNFFSGKVSVSVADSGETALVVSILPGNQVDHMPNDDGKVASMVDTGMSCSNAEIAEDENLHLPTTSGIPSDVNAETDTIMESLPSMSCSKELMKEFCTRSDSGTTHHGHGVDIVGIGDARDDHENVQTKGEHSNPRDTADCLIYEAGTTNVSEETEVSIDEIKVEEKDGPSSQQEGDAALPSDHPKGTIVRLEDDKGDLNQENSTDIMSIVRGTRKRPFNGHDGRGVAEMSLSAGGSAAHVRVKKIMRRTSKDKDSSVVKNLGEEIREAVRNKSSNIEESLSDPKLLAAFRAVISGTEVESVTNISRLAVKAKKSLLQKGKVRESLTRKIYATNNGKRKRAWDRECDVEFWKYRCMRTIKPEKIETLKSVLGILRGNPLDSPSTQETDQQPTSSILSRLYLADTSVMPRKDAVKPLTTLQSVTGKESQQSLAEHTSNSRVTTANASKSGSSASHVRTCSGPAAGPQVGGSKGTMTKAIVATSDDLKSDKRKWALEILARKNASISKGGSADGPQDNDLIKGNYPLLAQLPMDMRPALAAARHNKIPISVRQTHLYRLTEHFLRKADLPVICRNADTELAVADAINTEKDVADRSSSKLVYVNLCSQMLLRRQEDRKFSDATPSCPFSLATGAPDNGEQEVAECHDSEISGALRAAGLLSDSPPNSPLMEAEPYDGETDICMTEKEAASDTVLETSGTSNRDVCPDDKDDSGGEECLRGTCTTESSRQLPDDGPTSVVVSSTTYPENSAIAMANAQESHPVTAADDSLPIENKTDNKTPLKEHAAAVPCDFGNPSADDKRNNPFHKACDGSCDLGKKSQGKQECDDKDDEHNKKCDNDPRKLPEDVDSIRKKVEAYVKEHIRPLCKSGVITTEQYRWAVGKTAEKVMRYHKKAKNAGFLIKEGEKVKRLAEQYAEAAQAREQNPL